MADKEDKEFCDHCLLPVEFGSSDEALCRNHAEERGWFDLEIKYKAINMCNK